MNLTLIADSLLVVNLWIDASYNTHNDCRGYKWCMMSLGKGVVLSSFLKQKLNAKSSTGAELLGSHDGLSVGMWNKNFIEAQGYTVEPTKLYQDKNSIILIENNWKDLI